MTADNGAVAAARAIVDDLERQRQEAERRGVELAAERGRIAFAAHTGDKAARKRLDAVHREIAAHDSEIAAIDAAIAEGRRRLREAEIAAERAGRAERAEAVVAALDPFRTRAARLDRLAVALAAEYQALEQDLLAMHTLGLPRPEVQTLRVAGRRAFAGHLVGSPLAAELPHLAPAERHSFAELAAAWTRAARAWARAQGAEIAIRADENAVAGGAEGATVRGAVEDEVVPPAGETPAAAPPEVAGADEVDQGDDVEQLLATVAGIAGAEKFIIPTGDGLCDVVAGRRLTNGLLTAAAVEALIAEAPDCRFALRLGGNRFGAIEGQRLNDRPLSRREAEILAATGAIPMADDTDGSAAA